MTIQYFAPFVLVLVAGLAPSAYSFSELPNEPELSQKIQGRVDGFGALPRDGWVDASAVIPSLSEDQILNFDFASLLSPNEPMKAGPISMDVPGNVYIPRQSERYGLLPVTLEKGSFSVYLNPNESHELFTVAVKAPFAEVVKKAQDKAPASEIMKLIKFNKLGFASSRNWSRERNIVLDLGQSRPQTTQLRWNRNTAANLEADVVLNFEETAMQRWIVSDLNTDPTTSLNVSSTNFNSKAKLLLGRSKFTENNKLDWMKSWFPTHNRPNQLSFSGVPSSLQSLRWEDEHTITWNASGKLGWVTVFVEKPKATERQPGDDSQNPIIPEFLFVQKLVQPLLTLSHPKSRSSDWVRVEEGRVILPKLPTAGSTITLVFLGGQRLTDAPNLGDAEELHVYNISQ